MFVGSEGVNRLLVQVVIVVDAGDESTGLESKAGNILVLYTRRGKRVGEVIIFFPSRIRGAYNGSVWIASYHSTTTSASSCEANVPVTDHSAVRQQGKGYIASQPCEDD